MVKEYHQLESKLEPRDYNTKNYPKRYNFARHLDIIIEALRVLTISSSRTMYGSLIQSRLGRLCVVTWSWTTGRMSSSMHLSCISR